MNRKKAERCLVIGLFGAVLTLAGDLLIGAYRFPDGANMLEGSTCTERYDVYPGPRAFPGGRYCI